MAEKPQTKDLPSSSGQELPVEKAIEVVEPLKPNLRQLSRNAFTKSVDYFSGELQMTADEYLLLSDMNNATIKKYEEMRTIVGTVDISLKELVLKYNSIKPFLEQLDNIESSVTVLEETAYQLDAYCKKLEAKFKKLEKK